MTHHILDTPGFPLLECDDPDVGHGFGIQDRVKAETRTLDVLPDETGRIGDGWRWNQSAVDQRQELLGILSEWSWI